MTWITVCGTAVQTSQCTVGSCLAKIFPRATYLAHMARHADTGVRVCPAGHVFQALDLGEWRTCPKCRSDKVNENHRQAASSGGRPRGDNYKPRKGRPKGSKSKRKAEINIPLIRANGCEKSREQGARSREPDENLCCDLTL